jgi:hypothetical protein
MVVPDGASFDAEAHLAVGDVRVNDPSNPEFLEVRLKASKTDPFRQGVSIYLGKTHSDICPVAAVLAYAVQRGQAPGPFFQFTRGHPLTRAHFVEVVWRALQGVGCQQIITLATSFGLEAATTAVAKGVPDSS